MIEWLKKQWQMYRRSCEANNRGWAQLGKMLANGRNWTDEKWAREIRRENRLYRLAAGRSPWKPYGKF